MTKSLLWRFGIVAVVMAWAITSAWPPTNRSLVDVLQKQAQNRDSEFEALVQKIAQKKGQSTLGEYEVLREAIAEQKIQLKKYFPTAPLANENQDDALQEYLKAPNPTAPQDPLLVLEANRLILRQISRDAEGKIHLGLDLKGGSSFLIKMDLSKIDSTRRQIALDRTMEIIRHRVDTLGVSEPLIQPVGTDRIMVQIPGALTDEQRAEARQTLKKVSLLEFRLVYTDEQEMLKLLASGDEPPIGYERKVMREKRYNKKTGKREWRTDVLLVKDRPEQGLTGKDIQSARAFQDSTGTVGVGFEFNHDGAKIFENITQENIGHRLAILLDGELQSAPVIHSVIYGNGQITGNFSVQDAQELANTLQNPLEHQLEIQEERTVSATLGADSVKKGFESGLIGLSAVMLFMAGYYLAAGLIANLCLLLNMILVLGVLAQFGFTLTLPGIAAFILTIGMAVDANVLIYERLREELASGKKLTSAVRDAFKRTTLTILDANVTTLITALVLIKFGAGPVLGFAVVLTVGIVCSVLVALVACHLIFDALTYRDTLKEVRMFSLIRSTHVNFLRWRNQALAFSVALIILGGIGFAKHTQKGDMFGVDFTGGFSSALTFDQKVPTEELNNALETKGMKDFTLQYQTQLQKGGGELLTVKASSESGDLILAALKEGFPQAKFQQLGQMDRVGAVLGKEFAVNSALGLGIGMVLVLIYVSLRFEVSFAIGAIVALFHDVIITIGIMAICGKPLTLPIIGAVLTIAGYSINDTIVIFDRIREGIKIKKGSLEDVMNASINETLSRTLLTSSTALITLAAVFFFGGSSIHDFAFALIVGVVTGTYSSIFIASPIVLLWGKRKGSGVTAGKAMASKPL